MLDLAAYQNFYLMGIKGVAMTALAQILIDWGKQVSGCDVAEEFVTQKILNQLQLAVENGFTHQLPEKIECVVYTAAHGGVINPIVQQAQENQVPIISQAEALAYFFNQKKGIAVCGVGGKSTVSAMIAWILEQNNLQPSFSVGVGEILGMQKTGQWVSEGELFVAEADEYMMSCSNTDQPTQINSQPIPRFSFLKPVITICTNLEYDHPDVYHSLQHTQETFAQFFLQTQKGGSLIINADSPHLQEVIAKIKPELTKNQIMLKSYDLGETDTDQQNLNACLLSHQVVNQVSQAEILLNNKKYLLKLKLPGRFNLLNALAALLACSENGVAVEDCLSALASFQGTSRRFQFIDEKNGVLFYDDYAHHPHEIDQTIRALNEWHPQARKVVAFQPHTYSRTKEMLDEFVLALSKADEVLLLDIFASARENYDPNISSDMLVEKVQQLDRSTKISNLKTIESLADYCQHQLHQGDVLLTMGAGDIYQVHELL